MVTTIPTCSFNKWSMKSQNKKLMNEVDIHTDVTKIFQLIRYRSQRELKLNN